MTRRTAALLLVAVVSCTKPKTYDAPTATQAKTDAADPWQTLTAEVKKAADPAACRRALAGLNAELVKAPATPGPDAGAKNLIAAKTLADDEAKDLTAAAYTGVDGRYLSDCLYLRDAARSLDVAGRPPAEQAAAAFDWTCRQVYLRPAVLPFAVPPTDVLRRGNGVGLERAYVFLAVAQQLGLDGVFIGPPGNEAVPMPVTRPDGQSPRGPFWAVGVKAGTDTFLFDPWRGEAVTVPGEPGGATLARFQAALARIRPQTATGNSPWDMPWDDLQRSIPYAVVPLPAAASRLKLLEDKLAAAFPGLNLFVEVDELATRVGGPVWLPPAAPPGQVDPVTQQAFATAYPRLPAALVAQADGGKDAGGQRSTALQQESLPIELLTSLSLLKSREAQQTAFTLIGPRYFSAFLESGVREKMHRGQFNEVVKVLVGKEGEFAQMQERLRTDTTGDTRIAEWAAKANAAYDKLSRSRLPETRGTAVEREAEAGVTAFWQAEAIGTLAFMDKALASVGRSEAGYLLALCQHEKAVRAQARADREPSEAASAADAWATVADAWNRFLTSADGTSSGRVDHAKKLAAKAKGGK